MKKKVKVFVALLMVMVLILGITITVFAVTPQYKPLSEYGYTGVPDIDVKIPEEYQVGIDKAVDEAVKESIRQENISDKDCDYQSLMVKPELVLTKNEFNSNGERHIKISWKHISGADEYRIYIADNPYFKNYTMEKKLPKTGTYWNFVLKDNSDYYIHIVPVFITGKHNDNHNDKHNDKYTIMYGRFSDTILARQL